MRILWRVFHLPSALAALSHTPESFAGLSGGVLQVLTPRQLVMTIMLMKWDEWDVVLTLTAHGCLRDRVHRFVLVIAHTHVKKMRDKIYIQVRTRTVTIVDVNAKIPILIKTKILMLHVVPEIQ